MKIFNKWYCVSLIILLCTCTEEEVQERGYPIVAVTGIEVTTKGATLTSSIQFEDLDEVTDHGFVWGKDKERLSLAESSFVRLGKISSQNFTATIGSALELKTTYYARGYAKTKTKTVYGPVVKFASLGSEGPVATSFTPTEGAFGDTVLISGKNFSFRKEINIVTFGGIPATVTDASDTELKVVVPSLTALKNIVKVKISDNASEVQGTFNVKAPVLKTVVNSIFTVCDTVIFEGETLGAFGQNPFVTFNSYYAQVISISSTQIKVAVPVVLLQNPVTVKINNTLFQTTAPFTLTQIRPEITSVSPLFYNPGDTLTVAMRNWPSCQTLQAELVDIFSSRHSVRVIESSAIHAKFIVPQECIPSSKLRINGNSIWIASDVELKQEKATIISIEPNSGKPGDEVLIRGENLPASEWWEFATNLLDVTSGSATELRGTVRENFLTGGPSMDVYVGWCGETSIMPNAFTYDLPEIHSVSPTVVSQLTDIITIRGKNFSTSMNDIEIGGAPIHPANSAAADGETIVLQVSEIITNEQIDLHIAGKIKITTSAGLSVTSDQDLTINYEGIWNLEPSLPAVGRTNTVFMSINGKGYTGLGVANSISTMLKDWWEFDASTGWTQRASFPENAQPFYSQSAVADEKGYVGFLNSTRRWWQYDPVSDQWQRKADFPGPARLLTFAFSLNNKVYIGGGKNVSDIYFKDFWEYDPATDQWTQKANSPDIVPQQTGFSHDGLGYTFGTIANQLTTFVYNAVNDQWTTQKPSGGPTLHSNWKVEKFDDFVILQSFQFSSPHLYKFIPGTNTFYYISSDYGAQRGDPSLFVINNRGYIGLGYYDSNYLSDMWSFDPAELKY